MGAVAVVGAQWGDEGKGKLTDFLAAQAQVVARYSGGSNAGHTVVYGGREFHLHQVPSGILYPGTLCLVGNGVVLDPPELVAEMDALERTGISLEGLRISPRAHLVMPYHRLMDRLDEEARGEGRIGTTGRGIGPAYTDKAAREGIRVAELADPDAFRRRLAEVLPRKRRLLEALYGVAGSGAREVDAKRIEEEYLECFERLAPYVADTSLLAAEAIAGGKRVLLEGAQGTLLDVDWGTYPFVTSSSPIAGGACTGLGIGPTAISQVIGVVKAYSTRVGSGPMPTELKDAVGHRIRETGREYGTTTGRPRRVGWFDAVPVRLAVRVNGLTGLAVTLLDVLTGIDPLRVCVGYRLADGRVLREFPVSLRELAGCEPVYREMPGWHEPIGAARTYEELPEAARAYLEVIAEEAGAPIALVSVGRGREQTVVVRPVF